MKTLMELKNEKKNTLKINDIDAQNRVCQEIILNKIAKSELADKTFLKGGVVVFNMSKNELARLEILILILCILIFLLKNQ